MMNSKNQSINKKRALQLRNALFKNKKLLFISLGIIAVTFLFFMNSPSKFIVIEDIKSDKILWKSEITTDEWFYHQYIHSVERSIVIEKFRVNEHNQIVTMESWTESFGAGLPYEQQGTVAMIDGFYVMKDLNRPVHGGVLNMHPSDHFPHSLYFRDQEILLSESPYARRNIRIVIKSLRWFNKL